MPLWKYWMSHPSWGFSGVFPLDARADCAVRELFFVSAVSLPGASLSSCCHSGVSLMSSITSEAWRAVDHEGQEGIIFISFTPSKIIASPSLPHFLHSCRCAWEIMAWGGSGKFLLDIFQPFSVGYMMLWFFNYYYLFTYLFVSAGVKNHEVQVSPSVLNRAPWDDTIIPNGRFWFKKL